MQGWKDNFENAGHTDRQQTTPFAETGRLDQAESGICNLEVLNEGGSLGQILAPSADRGGRAGSCIHRTSTVSIRRAEDTACNHDCGITHGCDRQRRCL